MLFVKKILFIFSLLAVTNAIGQTKEKFSIDGTIKGLDHGKIKLLYIRNDSSFKVLEDIAIIKQGKFSFTGSTPYPYGVYALIDSVKRTDLFFIDQGEQQVSLNMDSFYLSPQSTSFTNKEYKNKYLPSFSSFRKEVDIFRIDNEKLHQKYQQNLPFTIVDSIEKRKQFLLTKRNNIIYDYIRHNPNSYGVFWELYHRLDQNGYAKLFDSAFHLFTSTLKNTATGKSFEERLIQSGNTDVGAIFPAFLMTDSSENNLYLQKKLAGKYTLIDFWFSNCGPCIRGFSELKKLYEKFHSPDFNIIGISIDEKKDKESWLNTIKKYNLPWPQYLDIGRNKSKLLIYSFPTTILLDKDGKILFKNVDISVIEKYLSENNISIK